MSQIDDFGDEATGPTPLAPAPAPRAGSPPPSAERPLAALRRRASLPWPVALMSADKIVKYVYNDRLAGVYDAAKMVPVMR